MYRSVALALGTAHSPWGALKRAVRGRLGESTNPAMPALPASRLTAQPPPPLAAYTRTLCPPRCSKKTAPLAFTARALMLAKVAEAAGPLAAPGTPAVPAKVVTVQAEPGGEGVGEGLRVGVDTGLGGGLGVALGVPDTEGQGEGEREALLPPPPPPLLLPLVGGQATTRM